MNKYRIAGNFLRGEKTFTNFAIFQPSAKVFSTKFEACHTHYATNFNVPRKFSPRNATFLPIRESFLPRKFPAIRYARKYPYIIIIGLFKICILTVHALAVDTSLSLPSLPPSPLPHPIRRPVNKASWLQ